MAAAVVAASTGAAATPAPVLSSHRFFRDDRGAGAGAALAALEAAATEAPAAAFARIATCVEGVEHSSSSDVRDWEGVSTSSDHGRSWSSSGCVGISPKLPRQRNAHLVGLTMEDYTIQDRCSVLKYSQKKTPTKSAAIDQLIIDLNVANAGNLQSYSLLDCLGA